MDKELKKQGIKKREQIYQLGKAVVKRTGGIRKWQKIEK